MYQHSYRRLIAVILLSSLPWAAVRAAEPSPSTGDPVQADGLDRVKALLKDLKSDDFDAREDAEDALKKCGGEAIPVLQAALEGSDPETRMRLTRVLDLMKWNVRPAIKDLARVIPRKSMFMLGTPALRAGLERLGEATPLGKLYLSPETQPAIDGYLAFVQRFHMLRPRERLVMTDLPKLLPGMTAIGMLDYDQNLNWPQREKVGFVFEPEANDGGKGFEFLAKMMRCDGEANEKFRGLQVHHDPDGRGSMASASNVILFGSNFAATKMLINQVADGGKDALAAHPAYAQALEKTHADALAWFWMDFESLSRMFGKSDRRISKAIGFDDLDWLRVALWEEGGLIREKGFAHVAGDRTGLVKMLSLGATGLEHASLAPAEALVFVDLPLDGAQLTTDLLAIIEKVDGPRSRQQFDGMVTQFTEQINFDLRKQLLERIKGETALWMSPPLDGELKPQFGAAIDFTDEAAARDAAKGLAAFFRIVTRKETNVVASEIEGHACFGLAPGAVDKDFPYTPAWCADGTRIFAGSSTEALTATLKQMAAKDAGLAAVEDYKATLAKIPAAERGGIVYARTGALSAWGYRLGAAFAKEHADDQAKEAVAKMPDEMDRLLKPLPGTVLSVKATEDGVLAQSVGALPASGYAFATPFFGIPIERMMRMARYEREAKAAAEAARKEEEKQQAEQKAQEEKK